MEAWYVNKPSTRGKIDRKIFSSPLEYHTPKKDNRNVVLVKDKQTVLNIQKITINQLKCDRFVSRHCGYVILITHWTFGIYDVSTIGIEHDGNRMVFKVQ